MCFFFFFQAEDGIRDLYVTGVQTCALPISRAGRRREAAVGILLASDEADRPCPRARSAWRSEERRVGKECRSRWSPAHQKRNLDPPQPAAASGTVAKRHAIVRRFMYQVFFFFFKQKTAYEIST